MLIICLCLYVLFTCPPLTLPVSAFSRTFNEDFSSNWKHAAKSSVKSQDRRNALAGIDILRKTCNHPDLLQRGHWEASSQYGAVERSGKLLVTMKARTVQRTHFLGTFILQPRTG